MKISQSVAALVLLASGAVAQAEVTGTVTVTSDYDFRGFTQTAQDPALQGSIDYANDSGWYVGAWGSNVDFGDCCDENIEVDVYAGFRGGETFPWDVGVVYYAYPGAESIDFAEVYASVGYKWLTGKIWYSNDFGNSGDSAFYYEANAAFELPANFGATLHVGRSDGDFWEGGEYTDWAVGVTYPLNHFNLSLKWVDGSDADYADGTPDDVLSTEARAIFSVSTTFPWSKE